LAGVPAALLTVYALREGAQRAEPPPRIDRIVIVERQSIVRGSTSYDLVERGQSEVGSD
jgi:hypothetical protein